MSSKANYLIQVVSVPESVDYDENVYQVVVHVDAEDSHMVNNENQLGPI
jgi:hypothetical protein